MEFQAGTLTISRNKRAGSNLDQESKRTAHFRSSWQQNVNVFSSSSRPPCVEELHQEAQLNLQSLLQEEYGELTRDSQAASNTFGQKSSLSSRESTPESGRQGERRLEFVLMPTASRFIEDETSSVGIRAREASPLSPTASVPQPGWSQAVSLSTPEEKRWLVGGRSVQAHVVPINVTGETLERHANTRHSLFNTDTAINPKSTLRRRRTVSSLLEATNPQRGVCAEGPVSPRGLGNSEPAQRLFTFDDEPRLNGRRDSASSSGLRKVLSDLGQLSHPNLSPCSENTPLPANHTQTMKTSHSVHTFPSLSNSWDTTRGASFSPPWTGLGGVCPPSSLGSGQAHAPSLPSDLSDQAQPIPSHLSCPSLHAKPGPSCCLDNRSSSGPLQCVSLSSPEPGPAMSTFLPSEGQVVTPLFPTRAHNIKNIRTNHERIIVCTDERGEEKPPATDARSFRERSLSTPTDSGSSCSGDGFPGPCGQHRRNSESYVMRYPSASSEDSQGPEPQGPPHARPRSRSISLKKPKRKPPPPVRGVSLKPGGTGLKLQIFEPQATRADKRPTRLFLANEKRGAQSESMDSNESNVFISDPRPSGPTPSPRDGDFSDHWFLNDWKSIDPYRSLSNSSTATGTTVIECLKPRGSCESLSSPSLTRATTPSQLSVEIESKLSSPGRLPGLMSPSSGYSSQSETPTAGFPMSVFHGGPAPHQAGKTKPKVPERKSSLQPPSPSEKSPRSKQVFELPVTVPIVDLSALKPPTKAKPKAGRRHSETTTCNGGKPAPSPSQPALPVITQTVLESVRLRSVSRSENEDNSEAFPEPPAPAPAPTAPGHRKVGPPVAGKPPMSKRPSSIVLKVSPNDLTSSLMSPPGTCPAPSPTWIFRKTRMEEGVDSPLCPRLPSAVSPGFRVSERTGLSQAKLSTTAPELPAEVSRGRGEVTGGSAQLGERLRERKKSKTPPPVPRKPTVLILPTNRQHILVVTERSERSTLPSPIAPPPHPGITATNTASESQAPTCQPDTNGAPSPTRQPPSPACQPPSPTRQPPSPARQPPSPARQSPSPARQPPSPARQPPSPARQPPSPARQPPSPACQPPSPARQPPSPACQPPSPACQPPSPACQPPSPTCQPPSPTRQPPSPACQPPSPTHQPPSPTYQPPSPTYQISNAIHQTTITKHQASNVTQKASSPKHQPTSPIHQADNITYQAPSPKHQIGSPAHQPESPTHKPWSFTRQPASPTRQPASPTRQIGSPTHQIGSPTHQEEYRNQNFNDGFGICLNMELNTDRAQILPDALVTRGAGQSGPGSLQSEDSITEEDEDVFVSPGVPRSTEDLFTVIHRSKRKVLGWKEPGETFRIRDAAPSPAKPPHSVTAGKQPATPVVIKASTSNENFKALLQRKGGKSGATSRVSATELLKTTNPLARRATDCPQEPERPWDPAESTTRS